MEKHRNETQEGWKGRYSAAGCHAAVKGKPPILNWIPNRQCSRYRFFAEHKPKVIGSRVVGTPTVFEDSDARMPHETGLQDQVPEKTLAD